MRKLRRAQEYLWQLFTLPQRMDELQKAVGRIELRQTLNENVSDLRQHEFKVFSQWGEDGIIQFLIRQFPIPNPVFVEFGVQDYREANTRFLLQNNQWSGLVIDGSPQNIDAIHFDTINFRYALKAACAFIDRENINQLITDNGISGDIGLLSIDIDGNDYWVWEAISCVSPRIVICEYNSWFGAERAVTIPYDSKFVRVNAHYSYLYFGASVAAFTHLGQKKGYQLVGGNSAGNNLFFVRNDLASNLPKCTPAQAYVRAKFRESRNRQGTHILLDFDESLALIADMPVVDVSDGKTVYIRELLQKGYTQ